MKQPVMKDYEIWLQVLQTKAISGIILSDKPEISYICNMGRSDWPDMYAQARG